MPPKGSKLNSAEKKCRADAKAAALAKGDEYLEIMAEEHKEELEAMQESMRKLKVELARATGAAAISSPAAHKGKVDVPAFWEEDVEMWFEQVKAYFQRQSVGQERWYDCIMTELLRTVVTSSRSFKTAVLASATGTRC